MWITFCSVAVLAQWAVPKNSRSPGFSCETCRRWLCGISCAIWAAVRPRILSPQGSPESLNTRHTKPEQSNPPWACGPHIQLPGSAVSDSPAYT